MTLTSKDYREKIEAVNKDIEKLRSDAGSERKISVLIDYIDYLKDELKEAERAERSNKST